MMNKKNIGIFILAFVLFNTMYAQSNLLNAKKPSDIGKKTEAQKAVDYDKPLAYGYVDSYFTAKMTKAEINSKLFRIDTTDAGFDEMNAGNQNIDEYVDKINLTSQDIVGFKIKGLWYFDKRQG